MEDEFFATIKFVSGEEIICRISNCPEDDVVLIFEPMKVEMIRPIISTKTKNCLYQV